MNIRIIALTIIPCCILSCTAPPPPPYSENAYLYTHHIQYDTIKPEDGDRVIYQIDAFFEDSLILSSRSLPDAPTMLMRDLNNVPHPSPVEEALMMMAVGDSLSILDRIDTLHHHCDLPLETFIRYDIKLLFIDQKENYDDKRTAWKQ